MDLEARFIGRSKYIEDICERVQGCCCPISPEKGVICIVGLYGLAGVGKTRLAIQCIQAIQKKIQRENKSICISLRGTTSEAAFMVNVSLALGLKWRDEGWDHNEGHCGLDPDFYVPKSMDLNINRWQEMLKMHLQIHTCCHLVVLFDNAEDMALDTDLQNIFLKVCSLLASSNNVTVFITSRVRYSFANLHAVYKDVTVHPMSDEEASLLLHQEAPNIDFGEHSAEIVKLCGGVPMAIILTACELTSHDGILSPEDMVEFLKESRLNSLSPEACAQEEHLNHIIGSSIRRLKENLRDIFAQVNFIPGTFGADAAAAVIGVSSTAQAKKTSLIPLNRHAMLSYDADLRRFDIHSLLREWLESNLTIKELPAVRGRYTHFFGNLLMKLQKQLDSPDNTSQNTLVSMTTDMPNLRKLLHEAIHSTDETFRVYMELAMVAKLILENYMPVESVQFFKDLYAAAELFGDEMDQGVALSNVGMMVADHEGNRDGAKEKYEQARVLLERYGDSRPLALLLGYLAWNQMYRGFHEESIRLGHEACSMQVRLGMEDDLHAATSFNVLGVILMNAGRPTDALEHLLKALDIRLRLLPEEHISVATQYNSLGHCYGKIGDSEKALEFKKKSLLLKERVKTSPKTIIISIISVSDEYKRRGQLEEAEALLKRGLEIHRKQPLNPGDKAGMLTHLGDVYLMMQKDAEACDAYWKAVDITEKHEQNRVHVKYMVQYGKVLYVAGRLQEAKRVLRKAVDMRDSMRESESDVFEGMNTLIQVFLAGEERVPAFRCCKEAFEELNKRYQSTLQKEENARAKNLVSNMVEFYTAWKVFFPRLELDLPTEAQQAVKSNENKRDSVTMVTTYGKYPKPEPLDRKNLSFWKRNLAYVYSTFYPKPIKLQTDITGQCTGNNELDTETEVAKSLLNHEILEKENKNSVSDGNPPVSTDARSAQEPVMLARSPIKVSDTDTCYLPEVKCLQKTHKKFETGLEYVKSPVHHEQEPASMDNEKNTSEQEEHLQWIPLCVQSQSSESDAWPVPSSVNSIGEHGSQNGMKNQGCSGHVGMPSSTTVQPPLRHPVDHMAKTYSDQSQIMSGPLCMEEPRRVSSHYSQNTVHNTSYNINHHDQQALHVVSSYHASGEEESCSSGLTLKSCDLYLSTETKNNNGDSGDGRRYPMHCGYKMEGGLTHGEPKHLADSNLENSNQLLVHVISGGKSTSSPTPAQKIPVQSDDYTSLPDQESQHESFSDSLPDVNSPVYSKMEEENPTPSTDMGYKLSGCNNLSVPSREISRPSPVPEGHRDAAQRSELNILPSYNNKSVEDNSDESSLNTSDLQQVQQVYSSKSKQSLIETAEGSQFSSRTEEVTPAKIPQICDFSQQMPSLNSSNTINYTPPHVPHVDATSAYKQSNLTGGHGCVNVSASHVNAMGHPPHLPPFCQTSQGIHAIQYSNNLYGNHPQFHPDPHLPQHAVASQVSPPGRYVGNHPIIASAQRVRLQAGSCSGTDTICNNVRTPPPPYYSVHPVAGYMHPTAQTQSIMAYYRPTSQQIPQHHDQFQTHPWSHQRLSNQHAGFQHELPGALPSNYSPHIHVPFAEFPQSQDQVNYHQGIGEQGNIQGHHYLQLRHGQRPEYRQVHPDPTLPSMTTLSQEFANVRIRYPPDTSHV